MNLAALTLAAILSLLPASADRVAESARLDPLAAAIAAAVLAGPLPFDGEGASSASALALVAIGFHESNFDAHVLDCRKKGTRGDATAFQLLGPMARGGIPVAELCASYRLAADRALAVLVTHSRRCRRGGFAAQLGGYGSGSCGRPLKARVGNRVVDIIASRCWTWGRLLKAAHLTADCYRTAPITFQTTKGESPPPVAAHP